MASILVNFTTTIPDAKSSNYAIDIYIYIYEAQKAETVLSAVIYIYIYIYIHIFFSFKTLQNSHDGDTRQGEVRNHD